MSNNKNAKIVNPSKMTKVINCGYCPRKIYPKAEVHNRLHITKEGKPVCPVCRAVRFSSQSNAIIRDINNKYDKDKRESEKHSEEQALKRNTKIAMKSQRKLNKVNNN